MAQAWKSFRSGTSSLTGFTSTTGFQGGRFSRLTGDWVSQPVTIDSQLRKDLRVMQARSRDLVDNNATGRRFIQLSKSNIIGTGMILQMKIRKLNGDLDSVANEKIERAWKEWSKAANCTVTRRQTLRQFQRKVVSSWKMDGEAIVQIKRNFNNKFNFALMFIDPERLDVNLNRARGEKQTEIRLGVEIRKTGEPIRYYFKKEIEQFSTVITGGTQVAENYDIVPASEIIHFYSNDRVGQTRGYPLMASVMQNIKNLDGYIEAELIAARVAASKMGFYKDQDGSGFDGQEEAGDTGNLLQDAEPGAFEVLPAGKDFVTYDPQHPTSAFPDFIGSQKRDIASGVGVSYETLASDLKGANYSSMRAGLLVERDQWTMDQDDYMDGIMTPIFMAWLPIQMLNGNVSLPFAKIDRFNDPTWQGKRWPWVDPSKDVKAAVEEIDNQLKSRGQVISERGGDREDTFLQIKQDEKSAEKVGIELTDNSATPAPVSDDEGGEEDA